MKLSHNHEPDGIPRALWDELEAELPEHHEYLRRLRGRLAGCDSEMVNADTGLSTATAVAGFRAIRRQRQRPFKSTKATTPWWPLAGVITTLGVIVLGAAWNQNSEADRRQKAQTLETVRIIKNQYQSIANMVHREAMVVRESNTWRVPPKIRVQPLPAGSWQVMETDPNGESRWVISEILVERPESLAIPSK